MSVISGNSDPNLLGGTADADIIYGEGGHDVLWGMEGNDVIWAGAGIDVLLGGERSPPDLTAFSGVDELHGGTENDLIAGGNGDDHLFGDEGNDELIGGTVSSVVVYDWGGFSYFRFNEDSGNDSYDGGAGWDRAVLSYTRAAGVTLDMSDPNAVATIWSGGVSIGTITGVESVIFQGYGNATYDITTGAGNDLILGDSAADFFRAGGGADTLDGAGGANQIFGEGGDDFVYVRPGNEVLSGGDGIDTISYFYATSGVRIELGTTTPQDTWWGGIDTISGFENVDGSAHHDQIHGDMHRNVIRDMLGGSDFLIGNDGDDLIEMLRDRGDVTYNTLTGDNGDDVLRFTANRSAYGGMDFIDQMFLSGGNGNDTIEVRRAGKATIQGGIGNDRVVVDVAGGIYDISLGTGQDMLVLDPWLSGDAYGAVTVSDFDLIEDRIDLNPLIADAFSSNPPFQTGYLRLIQSGADTLLQVDINGGGDSYITLATFQNIVATSLTPVHFGGYSLTAELYGTGDADTLNGGVFADYLEGGDGGDTLFGEDGNDWLNGGSASDNEAHIFGPTDFLYGGNGHDMLIGGSGEDLLSGGEGDDMLRGGGGNDSIEGGNGFDIASYENAVQGVTVSLGLAGQDTGAGYDTLSGVEGLIGSGFEDVLTGTDGANSFRGGYGDDDIFAMGGDDIVHWKTGDGNDEIWAGEGIDTLDLREVGTGVVFSLAGGQLRTGAAIVGAWGFENITTGAGDDEVTGTAGANVLITNAGNDRLDGGAGADRMEGGLGDDRYVVDDIGDVVVEGSNAGIDLVEASISFSLAGQHIENLRLTGTAKINATGNALANKLSGNGNANMLDGGVGADEMAGGKGDDRYVVDNAGDRVIEQDRHGSDIVDSSVTYSLAGQYIEVLNLTGSAAINGTGNGLSNRLVGNAAANTLYGLDGNDRLDGGAGADRMVGGLGNDVFVVDSADDVIAENADEGTDAVEAWISYSLAGQYVEALKLMGSANLNGSGNGQINEIIGNAGNNVIDGKGGADRMEGGLGNDRYIVDDVADRVFEAADGGSDSVEASVTFSLAGQYVETLRLTGTAAINGSGNGLDNLLWGNAAANQLSGAGGADALHGGLGSDTLIGGAGADGFWFETALGANNVDRIADFAAADDTILLDRSIFAGIATDGTLAQGALRLGTAAQDADDRIVYDAATGNLWYDADGAGGSAAVLFAKLAAGTALSHADLVAVP